MSDLFPINAPASGRICSLDDHHPAFVHNRLLGVGPVIDVTSNQIVAPFDAKADEISASGDYIRLRHSSGSSLTLILGAGDRFQYHPAIKRTIQPHQTVVFGESLLTLNQALLRAGEPAQRRLTVLLAVAPECPQHFTWQESGAVSMLDSILFKQIQENS